MSEQVKTEGEFKVKKKPGRPRKLVSQDETIKVDLNKKEEDAVEEQKTDEVSVRDGSEVSEAMRQGYKKGGKARLSSSVKKQTLYDKLLKELPEGYLEDYKKIFLNDRGDGTFSRKPGDKGGIEIMEKNMEILLKK